MCIFAGKMGFCLCSEGGACLPGNGVVLSSGRRGVKPLGCGVENGPVAPEQGHFDCFS